ncbi:rhomboid family intramembrane serine protease [Pseudomonas alcaligenes]|uniref:Rhomboid family intramembrane serine protease n=1 Tax=Aquipseudomonas alcaligenes TaxID=43263 RepID=A0ABR7RY40_AQUAC|nr:rhomboid family intramembrane serine protease [Pseudomonas alcaligenes]MBC9250118.1 rhomboid family intramembrane serine protease [Pseudomonas alcaligenes]
MSAVAALRRPLQEDLSGFVGLLRHLQVPHRVSEERGEQVLWVSAEPVAEQVRELYLRYPQGDMAAELLPAPAPSAAAGALQQLTTSPTTSLVLILALLVALFTRLGDDYGALRWLTFQDFRVDASYIYFSPWLEGLHNGQWWRLVSPALIHFGVLHLAMNGMWYWELGRRIEARQGGLQLLGLSLLIALLSNLAQFWFSGPSLFGGLSGVLYGLLGYCWIFQLLAPTPAYRLPRGVLGMMLVWLLVCLSGVIDTLGFGSIANAAHVSGLLAGCATGLLGGALARVRR